MKDFQEFRQTIDDATIAKWTKEIQDEIVPIVDDKIKDNEVAASLAYTQMYAQRITMRMLEAYHVWLDG